MGLPHENWRMTTTPVGNAKTLTQLVGTQIRIAMVRQDVRQSQLARAIGKTEQWLSVRLRGRQPIDLNDLALIAQGLGVPIVDLLPDDDDMRSVAASPIARYAPVAGQRDTETGRPPTKPERPVRTQSRPVDNRPSGKPRSPDTTGLRRTEPVSRSGPGRRA